MLPSLDHLDGTDIEHGERIRAVQRLDELRPLIASQEEEYRSGIKSKVSKLNPNLCFSSLSYPYSLNSDIVTFLGRNAFGASIAISSASLCTYLSLPPTVRESQKAEMAREIAEGRSEYEREDVDVDDNRRAFWASKSKHAPGKSHFAFPVRTLLNSPILLYITFDTLYSNYTCI